MTEATMKCTSLMSLAAGAALMITLPQTVSATPDTGKPAPVFSGTDSRGKPVTLGNFKGKRWCWNGPTMTARMSGSITAWATCRPSSAIRQKTGLSGCR